MAYLGNGPLLGAYTHVDDISSSFDGSAVTFNITKNSISKTPVRAENFLVSIDGVFQEPYESYSILGSTVTFTEAPSAGSSFFGIILGNVLNIGAIPDGSVTIDKMGTSAISTTAIADGAVTAAKMGTNAISTTAIVDGAVTAAKIAAGAVDTTAIADSAITQAKLDLSSNLLFADGEKAIFGAGNDLQIYHDGSDSYIADAGTGRLYIRANDHITFQNADGTETYANFAKNGAVGLRYDNSTKLATIDTGVDVTGQLNADTAVIDTVTGNISLGTDAGGSISIGLKNNTSSTPYFDFNSGSTTTDYDVRIQAEGGNGTAGGGTFKITADNTRVEGEFRAYSYNETYSNITSSSGTANFDCESGNTFSITLSESVTTTNFQNPPASGTGYIMTIEVIQDSGGSGYLMPWPTSVDWPSATAPTLTATASGKDVFVFTTRDGGTTWYGFIAGQAIA